VADPESTRPRGRPRLYESASDKLSAFRARLEHAGYVRREVLVTRSTEERVKALAEKQGVKPLDVYSALVEYGLDVYNREHGTPGVMFSVPVSPHPAVEASPSVNRGATATALARQEREQEADLPLSVAPNPPAVTDRKPPDRRATDSAGPARSDNPIARFFQKRKETLK
jgi:hypothetical protein